MATTNQELLLAQLQGEVNRVLEYTGKLFVAANSNGKNASVAQVSKLKQVVRGSNQRFHEALDQLEEELQMAKLVMRRDLAIRREESGLQNLGEANDLNTTNEVNESRPKSEDAEKPAETTTEDIVMEDIEPSMVQDSLKAGGDDAASAAGTAESKIDVSNPDESQLDAELQINPPETNEKPSDTGLHIDTQTRAQKDSAGNEQPDEEDKPPDTGTFSNMNDLDSLFGGPISAGAGDAQGFDVNTTNPDDFDFDAFATNLDSNSVDNDNISALLPGLEDYANTQSNDDGEPDFDALFSAPLPGNGDDGENPGMTHRDSTFDGLGDLLDFNVGEFTGGMGGDGSNEDNEFDFSI